MLIPGEFSGQRIDKVLAQLYPQWSRALLTQHLKQGLILVNQQVCKPNTLVLGGEEIQFEQPIESNQTTTHQAEALPLDIVFEDEQILLINKAPGLIVHPGAGNPNGTLLNALYHYHPLSQDLPRAGIVHRLDKDTSGLMVVAKTLEAQVDLVRQLQARSIKRQYLALVYGEIIAGKTIITPFGRDPKNRLKMAVTRQGKEAITEFRVKKRYPFNTLLDVFLQTGRTHQIRVHLAHIQHAIIGDPLYQGRSRLKAGMSVGLRETLQAFKRQALHAESLVLAHPLTKEILSFKAPLPDDFQALLSALDKEADEDLKR